MKQECWMTDVSLRDAVSSWGPNTNKAIYVAWTEYVQNGLLTCIVKRTHQRHSRKSWIISVPQVSEYWLGLMLLKKEHFKEELMH